jgi:predicted nucleic acid-binding protein
MTSYSKEILSSLEKISAFVPMIWKMEVANSLYTAHKKKRISEATEFYFLELLKGLPIEPLPIQLEVSELLMICKEYNLTSYDACYFYLATSHDLPIATLDKDLHNAIVKADGKIYME